VSKKPDQILFFDQLSNTRTCWSGGIGELESVDHGRSRDSRSLSRRRGQIFSITAKDWLNTMFAGKGAGSAWVPGSSSPFFFFQQKVSHVDTAN
jgi:hypothetical protein